MASIFTKIIAGEIPSYKIAEMLFSKKVAHAIGKAIPCKKVGVAVIGLEVPHAHIHLIPINAVSDIDFSREKLQFTPAQMEEFATKIRSKFN